VSSLNVTESCLTAEERARLVQLLNETRTGLLALIEPLTEAQWTAKSETDGWSVQQIAEHLVMGEVGMLRKIAEAMSLPPNSEWEDQSSRKAKFLDLVLPDRRRKAAAPPMLHPHRNWTREETIARYKAGREKTLQFVAQADGPVKSHCADHPFPIFNSLSVYHWLLYIPLHNERHNQQIAEVLKDLPR